MKTVMFTLTLCTGLFILAACASAAPAQGAPARLPGTAWNLSTLSGKNLVTGSSITALFTSDGKVGGSSGCNEYSGTYTTSVSTIQISSPLASTMKACAQEIMDQETAYLQALGNVKTYSISGNQLTLGDNNQKPLLVYQVQSQDLAGSSWEVVGYNNGNQAVTSVLAGTTITANFGKDGTMSGNGGCNEYNGPVKVTGSQIGIGPLSTTRKACSDPAGVMEQETQYLAAIQNATTYTIKGNVLELRWADGALAADFNRK